MPSQTVTAARGAKMGARRPPKQVARARAPLRLGLAGGGTDVAPYCDEFGGAVLNATIDRYCYATIEGREDDVVQFHAADTGMTARYSADSPGPLPLHQAVYRRVCAMFDLGKPAITLTTVAECPPGSGLGSSSTLVVAVIEAFREFFSLPLDEYDVARLAVGVERDDCGLTGGRQDQYAATFGGFNMMEFGAGGHVVVNPLRLKRAIVQELEASLVLYYTGVSRSSAGIIEQQASHIRRGDPERLQATHDLKGEAVAMKEALLRGDLGTMAAVLNQGWAAKRRLADGISTDQIDEIFGAAIASGALAGKVSGAGGGGYLILLCEPTQRPELLAALGALPLGGVESLHFVAEGAVAWTLR